MVVTVMVESGAACTRAVGPQATNGTGGQAGGLDADGSEPGNAYGGRPGSPSATSGSGGSYTDSATGGQMGIRDVHRSGSPAKKAQADILGLWYLNRDGERLALSFTSTVPSGPVQGTSVVEGEAKQGAVVDSLVIDASEHTASWCAHEGAADIWYALHIQDGVLAGRYARVAAGASSPAVYQGRVTGWRNETFSQEIVPRVFDILAEDGSEAVLRIDRAEPDATDYVGTLRGCLKSPSEERACEA